MAPRVTQAATKSAGNDSKPGTKRALSPEKSTAGRVSDASTAPRTEKPSKRQRSSTVGNVKVASSAPATAPVGEEAKTADTEGSSDSEGSSEDEAEEDAPQLTGTFDLYGVALPFLHKVYSPAGSDSVFPEKLYKEILTYQAKNDRTAKITIPERFVSGNDGKFRSGIFCDPMEEMPFDIAITDIEEVEKLNFKSEYGRPDDAWDGPGLKARLQLEEEGCGIASSSGSLSIRPLWKKVDKDGKLMELFEGTFTFRVTYSSLYSRKGHGKGQSQTLEFWGVRGKA